MLVREASELLVPYPTFIFDRFLAVHLTDSGWSQTDLSDDLDPGLSLRLLDYDTADKDR